MEPNTLGVEETPEQAVEAISDALDFLRGEADAVGLSEVSDLLRRASAISREHSAALSVAAKRCGDRVIHSPARNSNGSTKR